MDRIRSLIQQARQQEQDSGQLRAQLQAALPYLHSTIRLPSADDVDTLLDFVIRYIEHVPDFIEAMTHLTRQAQVFDYADTFLRIAREYFLQPPAMINGHQGLAALMDEAYLAHRLMEEVNDRLIGYCGAPLVPMDMTRSNLIIHHLIGEAFANELDQAVHHTVSLRMSQEKLQSQTALKTYLDEHRRPGWQRELEQWPCLWPSASALTLAPARWSTDRQRSGFIVGGWKLQYLYVRLFFFRTVTDPGFQLPHLGRNVHLVTEAASHAFAVVLAVPVEPPCPWHRTWGRRHRRQTAFSH